MLPETVYAAAPLMQTTLWAKIVMWVVGIFFGSIFGMIVLTIVAGIIDIFLKLFPRIAGNFSLLDWLADHSLIWMATPEPPIKYTNYGYNYNKSYNYYTPPPPPKPKKPPKALAFGRLNGISYEKEGPEEYKFIRFSVKKERNIKTEETEAEVNKEINNLIKKYKKPRAKWIKHAKNTCKWLQNHKYSLISMNLSMILMFLSIAILPLYISGLISVLCILAIIISMDCLMNGDKWL